MAKFSPGDIVEAQSGTQGWVKGKVVGEYDVFARTVGGIMTQGQTGYMVKFTEGKHTGETIKLPDNYLRPAYHAYMGYSGEYDAQGNRRMGPLPPDKPSRINVDEEARRRHRLVSEYATGERNKAIALASGACSCGRPLGAKGMRTCGRRECIERLYK
jgi:hypothetical protein